MARFFRRQHGDVGPMLFAMIVCFFLLFSAASFGAPSKFTSPDETANFFFIQRIAHRMSLRVSSTFMPLGNIAPVPRSVAFVQQRLVPSGFYGLILLYGALSFLAGSWSTLFWTPFFAVLAGACAFWLLRPVTGDRTALLSTAFFFLHPAVWFYSGKPLFNNLPFLSFALIGLLLLVRSIQSSSARWFALLASLTLTAALLVRTSELFWLAPLFFLLWIAIPDLRRRAFIMPAAVACGVVLVLFFLLNWFFYENPLTFGYSALPVATESFLEFSTSVSEKVRTVVLPLGLELRNIGPAVWQYLVLEFPLLTLFTVFGLALVLRRAFSARDAARERGLLLIAACVSIPLLLVYGSWPLREYLDPTTSILASSYIRYWLPVYATLMPFAAIGFRWLSLHRDSGSRLFGVVLLTGIMLTAALTVYADPLHGLVTLRQQAQKYAIRAAAVAEHTSPSTLILSGAADKVLFPERNVVVRLPDGDIRSALLAVLAERPLAYYAVTADPQSSVTLERLKEAGFRLTTDVRFPDAMLYGVHP